MLLSSPDALTDTQTLTGPVTDADDDDYDDNAGRHSTTTRATYRQ